MSHSRPLEPHQNLCGKNGQATAEFLLSIPFLFVFLLGALEFTNIFVQAQRVASITREVTITAYRDCSSVTGSDLNTCIAKVLNGTSTPIVTRGINYFAGIILPDFDSATSAKIRGRIIIKVFTWTSGAPGTLAESTPAPPTYAPLSTPPSAITVTASYPNLIGFNSHYILNTGLSGETRITALFGLDTAIPNDVAVKTAIENQRVVFTGEVFYKYKAMTILGIFLKNVLPDKFYERALY